MNASQEKKNPKSEWCGDVVKGVVERKEATRKMYWE